MEISRLRDTQSELPGPVLSVGEDQGSHHKEPPLRSHLHQERDRVGIQERAQIELQLLQNVWLRHSARLLFKSSIDRDQLPARRTQ